MPEIIVALDGMTWDETINIAQILKGRVWGFKFNDLLHDRLYNPYLLNYYGRIMLDPKLYDIPNTVKNTMRKLVQHRPI